MPKRSFPFHSCSPLQMKTHVNSLHVDKETHLMKVYGKYRQASHCSDNMFSITLNCALFISLSCSKNYRSSYERVC